MPNQVPYSSSFHLLYIPLQPSNYRKKNNHIVPKALSVSLIMATDDPPLMGKILHPSKTKELKGTEKRDSITAVEKKYQQIWADDKIFEVNAPTINEHPLDSTFPADLRDKYPVWMGTMAFPYQNGRLHAGHVFSVSKVEFGAGVCLCPPSEFSFKGSHFTQVARMQGKRALFPMGFHATGMPIKAVADKLKMEIEQFGQDFLMYEEQEETISEASPPVSARREDATKFSSSKSKSNAKTAKLKYQFQIMESMGIQKNEIYHFADPQYWLTYFPPLAREDLTSLGCRIDWRRSFITTDINTYFDSFVGRAFPYLAASFLFYTNSRLGITT